MENNDFDVDGFHDELKKSMEGIMESFQVEDPNSFKLKVRFRNESDNENPKYANDGDSGFDLRANLPEQGSYTLKPLERGLIPTGLYFELPYGYEMQIRPRSGLAFKHGISVLNSPGTVDAPYRGEIKVLLVNISDKEFTFEHGERIAQAVIQPVVTEGFINLQRTEEELSETVRGAGGFGSTGTK